MRLPFVKGYVGLLLLCLLALPSLAQEKVTLSGYVKDGSSGEGLIGASVSVQELPGVGVGTNEYGFYSLTLPKGSYTLLYSYLGYVTLSKEVVLAAGQKLDAELSQNATALQEVEISTRKEDENVRSMEMSTLKMQVAEIKGMPALLGEVDIVKAIQMTPGVQTAGEGTSGFYVRGGGVDQNLILLDEAPVYNASHLMGFFSVFNADAIKDVQLYKGGIPAQHGGRLSSLLDIRMKEGNSKKLAVSGGIGTISSRLTVEAPIIEDKSSFILSGRRTYADVFFGLSGDENIKDNQLYFYDLNAKVNYTLNEKNRLFVSGYFGRDMAGSKSFMMDWGNATATLRWNHLFSDRLFSNTTLIFSDFDYALGSREKESEFTWKSRIRDYGLKNDYTYFLSPNSQLRFGLQATYHNFMPAEVKPGPESYVNNLKLNSTSALEGALYLSNEHRITDRLTLDYGLRLSSFTNMGPGKVYTYDEAFETPIDTLEYGRFEKIKSYGGLEPRLSAKYELNDMSSIKASYNRTLQYLHLVSNSTSSLPFDVWIPSSTYVKPQVADQVAAGYFRNFKDNTYEGSVEVYYKWMDNQIDYKDYAEIFLNERLETELLTGTGEAYGAEFYLRKQKGLLTGWVSYTLAKTERTVPGINGGKAYPLRYDRRHSGNLVLAYQFSPSISLGASWTYATGGAITMPVGRYEYNGKTYPVYSERNGYRLPDYHRLDLSATYEKPKNEFKKYNSSWTLSVYNAYNRKNAFSIYFRESEDDRTRTEAVKTYLFGIIPSLSYNFNF
ncbi:TonB-dependent receptor-like protein [Pontibacter ummariensis]|uniref:TonB-dependent Receptor Plug Domain n=1 Tax=Pontibacter ummariensis TaxID=1610492 RepID=A0A239CGK4_9BACT|nr:TonB-dependent receptor [Pontibacter ummariensis]PRY15021.1 TonB-dependent receptor-like protein [Pontibacter ummariensis]SNS19366.1 TonB-dependent Receptor Plug Domain [Pontibacter ummariensis]